MKIVVSFTSWTDRINMAKDRIKEMLSQTLQPDSIELNLATEDFPNKENDLPEELVNIIKNEGRVKINWCCRNDKVFLKLLPVVKKYLHKDILIVTLDDDLEYSSKYIETLFEAFINHHCDKFCMSSIPDNGGREIFRCLAFNEDIFDYLTPAIINNQIDDVFYRLYLEKKGKTCKFEKGKEDEVLKNIPKTTRGICDIYAPNGKANMEYINNAINEMKKSLEL